MSSPATTPLTSTNACTECERAQLRFLPACQPRDHGAPVSSPVADGMGYMCVHSGFKRRAPRAVKEIKLFAQKAMGASDVRIDQKLNQAVWNNGVKAVPYRIRVRIARCAGSVVL